jgi:hypothetical protein
MEHAAASRFCNHAPLTTPAIAALAAVVLAVAPAPAIGDDGSDVAIRVGDETITLESFESRIAESLPATFAPNARDSILLDAAGALVDKLVITREATTHVRGDTTGLADRIARIRDAEVLELYRDAELAGIRVTPEEADRVFEWLGEEILIRHVLCATPAQARAVVLSIRNGADLAEIAESQSLDAWTRDDGGLFDHYFTYGVYEGLDDAAYPLEIGEVAGPVWTERGWHVVRLEGRRPRERTPADFGGTDFAGDLEARRRDLAWREHLATAWLDMRAEWVDTGVETLRDLLVRHAVARDSLARVIRERRAEGDDVSALEPKLQAPPMAPSRVSGDAIARAGDAVYTIGEAIRLYGEAPPAQRPLAIEPALLRLWFERPVREWFVLHRARQNGFHERPEIKEQVDDEISFHLVERLYRHEIEEAVQPTDADVRAYYDTHAESFRWRPDLDLAVFRARDTDVLKEIRSRLVAGDPYDEVYGAFAEGDTSVVAFRTGMKRSFPDITGLDRLVRELGDRPGGVTTATSDGEYVSLARIEAVGESSAMTFADAYELALQNCTVEMREQRLRGLLDSLRVSYDAVINEDVVLRARPTEGGPR